MVKLYKLKIVNNKVESSKAFVSSRPVLARFSSSLETQPLGPTCTVQLLPRLLPSHFTWKKEKGKRLETRMPFSPHFHSRKNFVPNDWVRVGLLPTTSRPQQTWGWFPLRRIQWREPVGGTIACSRIEKRRSDWLSLILVAKKLNLIQLPELAARSPVNACFQLGFRAAHAQIANRLVARSNLPKWKPAFRPSLAVIYTRATVSSRL